MKDLAHGIEEVLKRFLLTAICTIGIFVAIGLIQDKLQTSTHNNFIQSTVDVDFGKVSWSPNIILVTGVVGVPVHELSHLIMAKLFGFKIADVDLLRPKAWQRDGILGYVAYYPPTKDNAWTNLGHLITGLAPMILGTVFMVLLVRLITPEVFDVTKKSIQENKNENVFKIWLLGFKGFWKGMFSLRKWSILRGILCFYLVTSISMHMSCSSVDLENGTVGYPIVAGIYLLYSIITAMIGTKYKKSTLRIAGLLTAFMSIGLFMNITMYLLSLLV